MAELPPAAQVMIAVTHVYQEHGGDPPARAIAAAALRAAADQVVPEPDDWDKDNFSIQALRLRCVMRDQLLAIAAELRGQNQPSSEEH